MVIPGGVCFRKSPLRDILRAVMSIIGYTPCEPCGGKGKKPDGKKCDYCHGKGLIRIEEPEPAQLPLKKKSR
jgi:DnaJ-class molecular chaperone